MYKLVLTHLPGWKPSPTDLAESLKQQDIEPVLTVRGRGKEEVLGTSAVNAAKRKKKFFFWQWQKLNLGDAPARSDILRPAGALFFSFAFDNQDCGEGQRGCSEHKGSRAGIRI